VEPTVADSRARWPEFWALAGATRPAATTSMKAVMTGVDVQYFKETLLL
jgi:hypothetical protein